MRPILQNPQRTFRYLNRSNRWLDFHLHNIEVGADGAARLASLPWLAGALPPIVQSLPPPDGPAGMALAAGGTFYFTHPAGHRVLMIGPCPPVDQSEPASQPRGQQCNPCTSDRSPEFVVPPEQKASFTPVPCLGGYGSQPTQFDSPRALLFHPVRKALFVADSGNSRIQIFDPHSFQLLDVWGADRSDSAGLSRPWALAADAEGNVYVVDAGADESSRRVLKFDLRGHLLTDFGNQVQATLQAQGLSLDYPSALAVVQAAGRPRLYILDSQVGRVLSFDLHGRFRSAFKHDGLRGAVGFAASENALYVGNNRRRQILQYRLDGTFVGAALGYEGPVAALMLDGGSLWVHSGAGLAPIRLEISGAYAQHGFLWGGPFANYSHLREEWHRLQAAIDAPTATHFQLFIYASANPQADPGDPHAPTPPWRANAIDLEVHFGDLTGELSSKDVWLQVPRDAPEAVFRAMIPVKKRYGAPNNEGWEPLDYIWIGAEFWSEGIGSPALSQMQLDYDHVTYLQHLPDIYGEHPLGRQVLGRFLSLFESVFEEVEAKISALPALFDPDAISADWLPWLANWLDVELREDWEVAQQREAIIAAVGLHGQRGTRRGLEAAIRRALNLDVVIEEPIIQADWWRLPDESSCSASDDLSILGFTTVLAATEPQGAVVGSTATLDGSHLITEEEFGAPLFQDLAHRFTVQLYRGHHLTPETLGALAAVLDREKPAHTIYHLCLVEPCMRVGFQARLGIDTIVAGPAPAKRLGDQTRSGTQIILSGDGAGRLGQQSQIGSTTRLGYGPAS